MTLTLQGCVFESHGWQLIFSALHGYFILFKLLHQHYHAFKNKLFLNLSIHLNTSKAKFAYFKVEFYFLPICIQIYGQMWHIICESQLQAMLGHYLEKKKKKGCLCCPGIESEPSCGSQMFYHRHQYGKYISTVNVVFTIYQQEKQFLRERQKTSMIEVRISFQIA